MYRKTSNLAAGKSVKYSLLSQNLFSLEKGSHYFFRQSEQKILTCVLYAHKALSGFKTQLLSKITLRFHGKRFLL